MVVATDSPMAVKARKGIMEFLLVNHPLDCPVCDEGGECQLQDLAFAFGADFSRMNDAKRTFVSESLGPVVKKEANRCIVCMRCVRYCDEIMGEDALTSHQRGVRTEISSFDRQPLECEQCGNCIEVCPVGALTALPYRFKARPWDLRQHVTICPWCSNGCSVRLGVRGTEILRARGTERRGVNQEYLCVRGRFGYGFVNDAARLTSALVRAGQGAAALEPASFDEAVAHAAARLREIAARDGADAIAFLGGEKLGLEEQYLFQKLARAVLGTNHVDSRTRLVAPLPGTALLKATGGGRPSISLDELGRTKEVLVLGDDLQGESPFLQAVLIRGQHQQGVHLTVAHPRRVKLARAKFGGEWLGLAPGSELALLNGLTRAALDLGEPAGLPRRGRGRAPGAPERARGVDARAGGAGDGRAGGGDRRGGPAAARGAEPRDRLRPRLTEHPQAAALLQAVENLGWATGALTAGRSCVLYAGPQSGTQGALDMGLVPDVLPGYVPLADAAARAPFEKQWNAKLGAGAGPDRARDPRGRGRGPGEGALDRGRRVAEERPRPRARGAGAGAGRAGDRERAVPDRDRAPRARRVPGRLLRREGGRGGQLRAPAPAHRARARAAARGEERRRDLPGGGARAGGGLVLPHERGRLPRDRAPGARLRRASPGPRCCRSGRSGRASPRGSPRRCARRPTSAPAAGEGLWLLSGGVLFQQGSLGHRIELLTRLAGAAVARLHPDELRRLGLAAGDAVLLEGPGGSLTLPAAADESVPPGAVFVPYAHRDVELNRLGSPGGAGLRVKARKAGVAPRTGA